jgi:hypothetical protein
MYFPCNVVFHNAARLTEKDAKLDNTIRASLLSKLERKKVLTYLDANLSIAKPGMLRAGDSSSKKVTIKGQDQIRQRAAFVCAKS